MIKSILFLFRREKRRMFKEITMLMADDTQKTFGFLAVGTTQYRYKQIFGKDLMVSISKLLNKDLDYVGDDADFSVSDKLAFIMNCQAEKKDMNCQNFETFLEWVEQFDAAALFDHMNDFIAIYLGNKESTSTPKKEIEP